MNDAEKGQWYARACQEAREALEKRGCTIRASSMAGPEVIPFALDGGCYLLEFEVGEDLATGLPRLLWIIHKEMERALTAEEVFKKAKLCDGDRTPAEIDGLLYRRCAARREDGRYDTVIMSADRVRVGRIYARDLDHARHEDRRVRAKLLLPPGKELGLFREDEAACRAITDAWATIDGEAYFEGRAKGLRCDEEE